MNPAVLPALGAALCDLAAYAECTEVTDETLADLTVDIERARRLLADARGTTAKNPCTRHPGGPVDPTADNTCLLCLTQRRRAHRPLSVDRAAVRQSLTTLGEADAAQRRDLPVVARALAADNLPSPSQASRSSR